jgi:hypothetical protein
VPAERQYDPAGSSFRRPVGAQHRSPEVTGFQATGIIVLGEGSSANIDHNLVAGPDTRAASRRTVSSWSRVQSAP